MSECCVKHFVVGKGHNGKIFLMDQRPRTESYILSLIVCFTSYFVFSIAVLPHSPGVVYYHLLLRRETRISCTLGSFLCMGDRNPIHPQPLGSCGPLQEKDA